MKARQTALVHGQTTYLAEAEDIFLTLEGSAQWAALSVAGRSAGRRCDPRAVFGSFGWRGKWWSQNEGFALFMALDRLAPRRLEEARVRRRRQDRVLEMLDEAIARAPD